MSIFLAFILPCGIYGYIIFFYFLFLFRNKNKRKREIDPVQ